MNTDRIVRIGGAAAHWMDSVTAVPQLLGASPDYIILDYLSEGAMSVLARMARLAPQSGFPPDFSTVHIGPHLNEIMSKGVKIIANAGGLNPDGALAAIEAAAAKAGVRPKVAVVKGDDLRGRIDDFRKDDLREMFHGTPFPLAEVLSANAYLGAFPIAAALKAGADIVITGRVADSSLALAALIAEFDWLETDYDLLSAGTLAGHLLECGCHSTGGTFTDWRDVADGWVDVGFPIAECAVDGSFVLTKPANTGGLVSRGTVAEQLLYEISDPQAYFVPDAVCDFSGVTLEEIGKDRVRVSGARGYPPTGSYKVTVTYEAGWRGFLASPIVGFDAKEKAERQGDALIRRMASLLERRNLPPLTTSRVDAIGSGATLGAHADGGPSREVVLRVVVDHPLQEGAELFVREQAAAMTSMSVGTTMAIAANVLPLSGVSSFLVPSTSVKASVTMEGARLAIGAATTATYDPGATIRPREPETAEVEGEAWVPLIRLAWARSGDKGGLFNVGVIARQIEYLPYIAAALTPEAVRDWYAHCFEGDRRPQVERYFLPGLHAFNFVVPDSLGGSILSSNRLDAIAKTMGQQLLAMPIKVPAELANRLGG